MWITLPGFGFPSIVRSHPFCIVWWDVDQATGSTRLALLVAQRRGFTRRLASHRDTKYRAWISGPFGQSKNYGDFGTVLMFATNVGIAAHIAYLKDLMEGRANSSIRMGRVVVVWQVKDSSKDGLPCRGPADSFYGP